ncbi:MAG: manganese transporter permease [Bdellovibrionia bacterium]
MQTQALAKSPRKWLQFTKERFDPASHLVMILLFVIAHRLLFPGHTTPLAVLAVFLGTVAFFFKLRLYDEIKDYELDLVINPTRPLARGLMTHSDLYKGIAFCIVLELALFGLQGPAALAAIAIAITYSLLMYKEFFIRDLIRPHLTTYAVSHTVVSALLSLALISAFIHRYPWQLSREAQLFALNSWCLFNIFEFGRKTFTSSEERDGVESYSKIFGRSGAVGLVVSMALASAYCLIRVRYSATLQTFIIVACAALIGVGAIYAFMNRPPYGKVYRAFSSIYIVIIYLGIVGIRQLS